MRYFPNVRRLIGLAVFFVFISLQSAQATKLVHRNVAELATLADRIFVGVCASIEAKNISIAGHSLLITEYTFTVSRTMKGISGSTVVFRQFGPAQGTGSIVGMPTYEQGKQYLLFLGKDSEFGLTSPIGFGQGAFLVFHDDSGAPRAINAFGNRGLFHRMDEKQPVLAKASLNRTEQKMLQKTSGALALDNLLSFVGKLLK